jgi:uncharacterized protein YlxW (UPF0749 family)
VRKLLSGFAVSLGRRSKTNSLLALGLAFALVSVASAEAETSTSEEKAKVVQVRQPGTRDFLAGRPFVAALDDEVLVDVRSAREFFQNLVDRNILPDPREAKDLAERETEKQKQAEAGNLPPEQRQQVLKEINDKRENRFQNAMDEWLQKMSLFLDRRPVPGLSPESTNNWSDWSDPRKPTVYHELEFRLRKTSENRDAWLDLLRGHGIADRPTTVSVGFNKFIGDRTDIIESDIDPKSVRGWQHFIIRTARTGTLLASSAVIFILLIVCLWLAISTDLLRDRTAPLRPGGRHPFSLGLCQMAFWLFIVAASFLFLWVVMGEDDTLTSSELTLLGISAATGLAAAFINQISPPCEASDLTAEEQEVRDVSKIAQSRQAAEQELKDALRELDSKRAQFSSASETAQSALEDDVESTSAKVNRLKKRVAEFEEQELYFSPGGGLRQFFLDLLRERNTVDFHRFQMMTWTLILGVIFIFGVFQQLAMPRFDATLLALMGISSGTYLGFKWPAAKAEA